jgi:hypothetical protein
VVVVGVGVGVGVAIAVGVGVAVRAVVADGAVELGVADGVDGADVDGADDA